LIVGGAVTAKQQAFSVLARILQTAQAVCPTFAVGVARSANNANSRTFDMRREDSYRYGAPRSLTLAVFVAGLLAAACLALVLALVGVSVAVASVVQVVFSVFRLGTLRHVAAVQETALHAGLRLRTLRSSYVRGRPL
jgi:hypothetical protein